MYRNASLAASHVDNPASYRLIRHPVHRQDECGNGVEYESVEIIPTVSMRYGIEVIDI